MRSCNITYIQKIYNNYQYESNWIIMASTVVNFRLDEDTKRDMEVVCEEMGITMSAAFNIFAKTVVRERRIPFEVRANVPTPYEVVKIEKKPETE